MSEAQATVPTRSMPVMVCHDIRQVEAAGGIQLVTIRITAEAVGGARPWPHSIPADLGKRIADLIAAECGAGG